MPDLCADNFVSIHFSIELRIKSARRVLNRFARFEAQMKENFLSYLVVFVFCCQSPPLLSNNRFYAPRSIVRNRYCTYLVAFLVSFMHITLYRH